MTVVELLPELQALPRGEKLRVVQFLVGELAREEESPPFAANASYPIWSPHEAFEAATVLQDMLEQEQRGQHG
jgi:hypothetical protein